MIITIKENLLWQYYFYQVSVDMCIQYYSYVLTIQMFFLTSIENQQILSKFTVLTKFKQGNKKMCSKKFMTKNIHCVHNKHKM